MTTQNRAWLASELNEGSPLCPERKLAAAVIMQAIADATGGGGTCGEQGPARNIAVAQARAFLTAETGPWAESRRIWCDLAGIDPTAMHERIRREHVR